MIFVFLVAAIVVVCIGLWNQVNMHDLYRQFNALRKLVEDHDAILDPEPTGELVDVPEPLTAPSCAVCSQPVYDPDSAIRVDAMVPLLTGREVPAVMFIHQRHAEEVPA